jgi:hypothetical protein
MIIPIRKHTETGTREQSAVKAACDTKYGSQPVSTTPVSDRKTSCNEDLD